MNKFNYVIILLFLSQFFLQCDFQKNKHTPGEIKAPVLLDLRGFIQKKASTEELQEKGKSKLVLGNFTVLLDTIREESVKTYESDVTYTVLSGNLYIGMNGQDQKILVSQGMIYLVPAGITHVFRPEGKDPVKVLMHIGKN